MNEHALVADAGTGAVLVKLGMTVLQRTAPKGIALVSSWWRGKEILIVGQPLAGKSTFIDYLQYGLFEDEKETAKTQVVSKTARFNVKMGRDAALELVVKTVFDTPGQIGAVAHADQAFEKRPHGILLFIDLTRPLTGPSHRAVTAWLREFARRLETRWGVRGRKRNRLRCMIVVLNKADKVSADRIEKYKATLRRIVQDELHDARGGMLEEVAIMPCILVTNTQGTRPADSVIAYLAKALMN